MKNKNHRKTLFFVVGFFLIITVVMALNTKATPDYTGSCGCHPGGYTISVNDSTIEVELSSSYILEVIGTGQGVVIDVYAGVLDNDLFTILPSNIIIDNSQDDLNPAANSIRVNLNITMPSQQGIFTLRLISRAPTFTGENTALTVADIEIIVGRVTLPPLDLFLDNINHYLTGFALLFMFIGTILFQVTMNRKNESKTHGIFMLIAFILITVYIFLILDETVKFAFRSIDLTIIQYLGQLILIILGSIGYITGIIVVFGTYSNVQRIKIKFPVYVMLLAWAFYFFFGIIMPTL